MGGHDGQPGLCFGRHGERGRGGCSIHHVTLVVLVVTQRQQDDVALVDPDLLAKLAADVAESAGAVEALRLQAAISKQVVSTCTPPAAPCRGGAAAPRRETKCLEVLSRNEAPGM